MRGTNDVYTSLVPLLVEAGQSAARRGEIGQKNGNSMCFGSRVVDFAG